MDFQAFVDGFDMPAAVMSVENTADNHCGDIYIVCANTPYKQFAPKHYHDNILYSDLLPKEHNFELYCYRCAVKREYLHSYAELLSINLWMDTTYMPICGNDTNPNVHYLVVCIGLSREAEFGRRASVSMDSAVFVIKACLNLRGSKNFVESIHKVVCDIQAHTDAFSCCIFLIDEDRHITTPLTAKYRDDAAKIEDFAPYLTYDVVSSWVDTVRIHDNIILKDDADLIELAKLNPVWATSLRDAGVKSLVFVPLRQGESIIGFLYITNFNTDHWMEIKEFVDLTAFFISSEVANNSMVERLEYLSNIDTLTGVFNRNAMNLRIDRHVAGQKPVHAPYGVIFVDLNGLKAYNDSGGHEAGDALLRQAALLLKNEFASAEIYRAGGDEFVVIMPATEKAAFETAVAHIREESGYGKPVCLALGSSWNDGSIDLRHCMHLADEAMYADKRLFYQNHPEILHSRHDA